MVLSQDPHRVSYAAKLKKKKKDSALLCISHGEVRNCGQTGKQQLLGEQNPAGTGLSVSALLEAGVRRWVRPRPRQQPCAGSGLPGGRTAPDRCGAEPGFACTHLLKLI